MVVKVVGEGRKAGFRSSSLIEDPDPQQLVMAWDAEEKARKKAAGKQASSKKSTANNEQKPGNGRVGKQETGKRVASKKREATSKTAPEIATAPVPRKSGAASATRTSITSTTSASKGRGARGKRDGLAPAESPETQDSALRTQDDHRPEPASANHSSPITRRSAASGNGTSYTGEQIQILEGVQHIRQRPGMYIGTTSTAGLLHLVYEAIDNVVDEFNAGSGSQMWVSIDADGRVTVRDEARGIPIDPKEWGGTVLPTATWIFIKPFTGGKFEPGAYKQAGGLHGVGLTVINALSSELEVDIWRDGQHFHQLFSEGQALDYSIRPCDKKAHGTQLRWLPDPSIFDDDATYDTETLLSRLEATSCLNRGLRIDLSYWDEELDQQVSKTLYSQHGLADYVKKLVFGDAAPLFRQPISIVRDREDAAVEVVLQPDSGYKTRILSFANGVRTPDGGTHETGFKAALTKVVNDYALKLGII
ncbi:MAG: ATP-binding protein, partial [Dehalococcoidales bacterium]|nr:ATP-binding protein [Dehalococcoidales bacterium]